jgi:general secretion pathway protein A
MYNDHYGLTGRPFQLTPDPRFYFDSATHRKAMAYLGYGLAQGEGFIVVTGEIGAGKTTLVGHLMAMIDPARVNAVQIVTTSVGRDDMLRLAAQSLGIATEGAEKAQLLGRIEAYLHDRARAGQRTLLVVDEAQNLLAESLEELRMLSNFQVGGQALLQIFLLGQPEFRDMLNSPALEQLRQRVIATHHLTPMDAEEVGPYIVHRMRMVGWNGMPDFTADAYAALYHFTGGIPRMVNMLASRVLLMGSLEQASVINGHLVETAFNDMSAETTFAPEAEVHAAAPVFAPTATPAPEPVAPVEPVPAPYVSSEPVAEPEPAPEPIERVSRAQKVPISFAAEPEAASSPEPAPHIAFDDDARALDLAARVAMLEAQVEEQDAALRRVLNMLVDWVENDNSFQPANGYARA